jgi:DNA-binding SARP family transcriptional activator
MQVRLFGELEAVAAGVPVPVRGAKQRALLALRPEDTVTIRAGALALSRPVSKQVSRNGAR